MTQALLTRGLALACLAGFALPAAAAASPAPAEVQLAANARDPYGNIDRRNDAGNDTGDSQVDRLNEGQLNGNYRGPSRPVPPGYAGPQPQYYGGPPQGYPPPGYAGRAPQFYGAPPPGYAGPPQGYGAPPPGYAGPPQYYGAPPPGYGPPPGYRPPGY